MSSDRPGEPSISPSTRERLLLCQRVTPGSSALTDALEWQRAVRTRTEVAGGELLATVGSSVLSAFDPLELDDVIELALGLLRDAAERPELEVAASLALGEVMPGEAAGELTGHALDRAWLLAARAEVGELVLDAAVHALCEDGALFMRTLQAGSVLGHALDVRHPHKRECRAALAALRTPELPERALETFAKLRERAQRAGRGQVLLRGVQTHAALDWLARLSAVMQPALFLQLAPRAGGLQPLGALQRALSGRALQRFVPALDAHARETFERLGAGAAVQRGAAVDMLEQLLGAASAQGGRLWIALQHARELDPPSLAVTTEAIERGTLEPLVWLVTDEPGAATPSLLRGVGHELLEIDSLAPADRTRVAESVLGPGSQLDVARRVALLGGETALGVAEAARTLVASGDLVQEGDGFSWRAQPRASSVAIPIEALLTERLPGLDPHAQRVLEALCTAPLGAPFALAVLIAERDGVSADAIERGRAALRAEGWLDQADELGPLAHVIQNAVRNAMPPARAGELNRFVADVLEAGLALLEGPAFGRALLAHHLAEGGREREASVALLDAAQAATESGFERMALRLAAQARRLDASGETASRARGLAHRVETGPPLPTETLESLPAATAGEARLDGQANAATNGEARAMAASAVREAILAIVRGDVESAERALDVALAAGWDTAAAQRLLSIAQLRRGDVPDAVRTLKQVHANAGEPGCGPREAIAAGLILLEAGSRLEAVRTALEALANARRAQDTRAERAALELLAACYRTLGRAHEADAMLGQGT